jgi:hypothetical protein
MLASVAESTEERAILLLSASISASSQNTDAGMHSPLLVCRDRNIRYMVHDHHKDIPLNRSLALEVDKWPIMSLMELVRSVSGADAPSQPRLYQRNHEGSKWSYSYIKELLLSAPRAPTTISSSTADMTEPAELTDISTSPQNPSVPTAAPTHSEDVATDSAIASTRPDAPTHAGGAAAEGSAASQGERVAPLSGNTDRSADATNVTVARDFEADAMTSQIIKLQKNLYISPSMKTDSKSQELWTRHIKDRLNAELWHALRTERCVQEFMMIGSRPDCLKASVVITCCGESATKRVRKVVKRLKWLRDFDVPCAVVVEMVDLYSHHQRTTGHTPGIEAQLPPDPTTLCGVHIRNYFCGPGPVCTLGGLILVEGYPFGLTVEHAFQADLENSDPQNANEDQLSSGADDICDDDEPAESPFVSFGNESDSPTSQNSLQSLLECPQLPNFGVTGPGHDGQAAHPDETGLKDMVYSRIGNALPSIGRNALVVHPSSDWALIEIDDPSYFFLNEIKLPGRDASIIIEDVVSDDFQTEGQVHLILARGGVRAGWLMSSPALLKAGNSVMDTRLIIMDRKLGEPPSGVSEDTA